MSEITAKIDSKGLELSRVNPDGSILMAKYTNRNTIEDAWKYFTDECEYADNYFKKQKSKQDRDEREA